MIEEVRKSPPMKVSWSPPKIWTASRIRRLQKMAYNFQVTIICGFVTILVLRGTIGAGRFGTPGQDFNELRHRLPGAQRTMMEFKAATTTTTMPREKKDEENLDPEVLKRPYNRNFDGSKYFDPRTEHHILGEEVKDWDERRAAFLLNNATRPKAPEKPRILLVSGSQPKPCDNANGDHLLLKNLKNKIDYCRLHGIEIFYNMAHLSKEMSGFWAKLPLIRKLMLSHPDVEWIWWMDSDAFFTDMLFELPMEKYKNHNLVVHGWNNLLFEERSWIGLNTGSFLIRNCQWSLDILNAWSPFGPAGKPRLEGGKLLTNYLAGRPDFEADDQSALIYLILSQNEKWGEKTYLESSFFLHGYWIILVDNFEKMIEKSHPGLGDDKWPFVTHFVGCKPCHGISGDYSTERCAKQMERAFNFADNQVLQAYGYHHPELDSFQVTKEVPKSLENLNSKFIRGNLNLIPA